MSATFEEIKRALFGDDPARAPNNYASKQLEKSAVVKTGDGWLYGFTVSNTNAAAQFVLVFDSPTLPPDTAVPLIAKLVPAGDAIAFEWLHPRRFESGLVLCNSSTQGAKTIGAADCLFDAQYL